MPFTLPKPDVHPSFSSKSGSPPRSNAVLGEDIPEGGGNQLISTRKLRGAAYTNAPPVPIADEEFTAASARSQSASVPKVSNMKQTNVDGLGDHDSASTAYRRSQSVGVSPLVNADHMLQVYVNTTNYQNLPKPSPWVSDSQFDLHAGDNHKKPTTTATTATTTATNTTTTTTTTTTSSPPTTTDAAANEKKEKKKKNKVKESNRVDESMASIPNMEQPPPLPQKLASLRIVHNTGESSVDNEDDAADVMLNMEQTHDAVKKKKRPPNYGDVRELGTV